MHTVRIRITTRWWLKAYLYGVALMAYALQAEPDMAKVERMVMRGVKLRVQPVRAAIAA